MKYKRILLKLSGETLLGSEKFGIDTGAAQSLAKSIKELQNQGLQIGIVIGGGNIFRGINLEESGIARTPADQMGMLATLMNGIALQQVLTNHGCSSKIMSALECPKITKPYRWQEALEALDAGDVVLFVGGTGNPYFTTDTAAALRANEMEADILLKATKVDGVFNKDPMKHPDAIKYDQLSYSQALAEKLNVMDATAIALCRSNNIPIFVFNMQLLREGKLLEALEKQEKGTIVQGE